MTGVEPLAGFAVGVTAARRAEELGALLVRRGARVSYAPAIRIVPVADDAELHASTRALLAEPPELVIATTGIGFRGWLAAAEGWGLADELTALLERAELVARGPKARGAIRAAGLTDAYTPPSENSSELLAHLLEQGVAGRAIAVQLHGEPHTRFSEALRAAGAAVTELQVYRWVGPTDPGPLDRMLDAVLDGLIDALPFTSAPAAASMLAMARRTGRAEPLRTALRERVVVACVGPTCAAPFSPLGVPVARPERSRLGALAKTVADELGTRARRVRAAGVEIDVRGQAAVVDGRLREIPPAPMAILRRLAAEPGAVLSRQALRSALPGGGEQHAVETAVGRLRTYLGHPGAVRTVVKRGYRLATGDPPPAPCSPAVPG